MINSKTKKTVQWEIKEQNELDLICLLDISKMQFNS